MSIYLWHRDNSQTCKLTETIKKINKGAFNANFLCFFVTHQIASPLLTICEFHQKRDPPSATKNSICNCVGQLACLENVSTPYIICILHVNLHKNFNLRFHQRHMQRRGIRGICSNTKQGVNVSFLNMPPMHL